MTNDAADHPVVPRPRLARAVVVIAVCVASTCVAQAFGRFTWGVVLPDARDDLLGGSNSLAGFFATLNVTAYLLGTLLMSWASSRMSLVGLVRVGLCVSTTSLAIASIAPNGPVLGVALFGMGIGGAIIWIPVPAIVARVMPPERAGMAIGFIGSGIGVGIVFAGQIAAFLDRRSDSDDIWQTVYRIELGVAVVVLVGAFLVLRPQGAHRRTASGGFGGFSALKTVHAWIPTLVSYAAFGFAYILVIGFLVARLEDDSGFTSGQASAMFSLLGLATVLGGLSLGWLADRIGRTITVTTSFVLFGGCALLVLTGSQPWVAIASFGAGMMFSGMPALIIAHVVDHTTPETYGPAFSAATLAFGIAQMVSPQLGGFMADQLGSFTWVFVMSAAVSFVGAACVSRMTALPVTVSTPPVL